ncbi:MAG: hypothetical protein Q4C01_00825 [Clostridia bacterium]|nr:hypothetical protein [Clostridia bacterium]
MISVLGLEAGKAKSLLEERGYKVTVKVFSSKKGQIGDEVRTVRQRVADDNTVELLVADFITEIRDENDSKRG